MHDNNKEMDGTWKNGAFASIINEYENRVLSSKHSIATRNDFQTNLQRGLKKLDNMTPKAFKAWLKVLFKLYDKLKADYKLTIGE